MSKEFRNFNRLMLFIFIISILIVIILGIRKVVSFENNSMPTIIILGIGVLFTGFIEILNRKR
jgi:hypothetical protein